jgi:hypothetical protein
MNKLIIGNFLKNMEISVMGKKMKLKLDDLKVESFVTGEKGVAGGQEPVTWQWYCTNNGGCGTAGEYCGTLNSCPTDCTCPANTCTGFGCCA